MPSIKIGEEYSKIRVFSYGLFLDQDCHNNLKETTDLIKCSYRSWLREKPEIIVTGYTRAVKAHINWYLQDNAIQSTGHIVDVQTFPF